jgi:hypothetical protein
MKERNNKMLEVILIIGYIVIFGAISLIFILGGVDTKHKVWGAVITLLIGALLFGGIYLDARIDADVWNGGYCECGGQWELKGVSESRSGFVTKYYACDQCRHEIEQ